MKWHVKLALVVNIITWAALAAAATVLAKPGGDSIAPLFGILAIGNAAALLFPEDLS
jgi:hypothetical protein